LDKKPDAPAGQGLHWEWNGKKWVPVPNKGVTAPVAAPAAAPAPSLSQILAQPTPTAEPSLEQQLADLANFWSNIDLSGMPNIDFSGIGSLF
jgi:hypothetical protein